MRIFTPRRSDHPTVSAVHFVSGIHNQTKRQGRLTAAHAGCLRIAQRAEAHGLQCAITVHDHFHACTNDAEATARLSSAANAASLPRAEAEFPMRASENFGLFGHHARSAMALLGAGTGMPMLHNPDYDFPDDLIAPGVALFGKIVDEALS